MEELLEMFLLRGARLPFLDDLLVLDRALPKSDFLALLLLQRRGEATMSELAGDLNVPLSTATGIGARLEKKKLVRREPHPKDKRVVTLRLTKAGQDLATRARTQIDSTLSRIQGALSPEEWQQLIGLAQKVMTALQAPSADGQPGGAQADPRDNAPRRGESRPNESGRAKARRIPIDD